MRSRTREFTTRISTAGTRPRPAGAAAGVAATPRRAASTRASSALTLAVRRVQLDEAVDAVDRGDGRQCRDHRGVRSRPPAAPRLRGRLVGEVAEHDDVGVLAERVLEPRDRRRRVGAHFALVDDRALVGVEHLHRVLDRDDVALAVLVHVVDHGGDGGGLARAGEAGHQHEAVLLAARIARPSAGRPSASKLGMPGSTRRSTRPT